LASDIATPPSFITAAFDFRHVFQITLSSPLSPLDCPFMLNSRFRLFVARYFAAFDFHFPAAPPPPLRGCQPRRFAAASQP
jgi:hypothetical protein